MPENRKQTQYILKGGMDWQLSERSSLTLSGMYDYEQHIDTAQVPFINGEDGQRIRYWHWSEDEVTGYMNYQADFVHKFKEVGRELSATMQYTRGWEDEQYFLNDSSAIRQAADTTYLDATENTTAFTLDYVHPLRMGRIEAGTKLQIRRIPISYIVGRGDQSIIYPGLGDWSNWGEDLYAGYANIFLEKQGFALEAGLRLEQVSVFYEFSPDNIYYDDNDKYSYFKLYSNVRFSYILDDRNRFSIFYNRRVDRPGEPELRLFPKYDDPELMKVGNPYLRPQFTQNFELAYKHTWASGNAFLSAYYKIIDDPYLRVYSTDDTDPDYPIINRIYQNVGLGTNTGLELLVSQDIGNTGKLSGSVNWYVNKIFDYSGVLLFPYERPFEIKTSNEQTWDIKLNNQWTLPKQLQVQITFIYQAPKNIPQGRQYARSSLDIGLKKSFFDNKLEASLSCSDIFNRFGLKQEIEGDGFTVLYENFYETQILTAGIAYKF